MVTLARMPAGHLGLNNLQMQKAPITRLRYCVAQMDKLCKGDVGWVERQMFPRGKSHSRADAGWPPPGASPTTMAPSTAARRRRSRSLRGCSASRRRRRTRSGACSRLLCLVPTMGVSRSRAYVYQQTEVRCAVQIRHEATRNSLSPSRHDSMSCHGRTADPEPCRWARAAVGLFQS